MARWIRELTDIGSQLRTRWRQGKFHAVVSIDVPQRILDPATLPLSIEERNRAWQFRRLMDRNRSIMGWIVVRCVLAAMLERKAQQVVVERTVTGKPYVPSGPGISLAHAGDIATVAFSSEVSIGIDVEQREQDAFLLPIIMNTLSPLELIYFARHSTTSELLLRAWTRKEAAVKVFGSGLAIDLTKVSVADQPGERFRCDLPDGEKVTGVDLEMRSDYVAALASRSYIHHIVRHHVSQS